MKKLVVALTALAAFTAPALAADMSAKAPMRAAPIAYAPSWTGIWISGGFGYGLAQYQHAEYNLAAPFALISTAQDTGAKGWLGKVGIGGDYQFGGNWLVGVFADADWSNIRGQYNINTGTVPGGLLTASQLTGQFKNDYSWAVGARVGWIALPGLLTYFNGGYTQAHVENTSYANTTVVAAPPVVSGAALGAHTRSGYFLGGGTEYSISQIPGLFWKSEVRFSSFENRTLTATCTVAVGCAIGPIFTQDSRLYEQRATTELVYRFNWGGPVVAKY
jgi:outer membrane immunogenic protein